MIPANTFERGEQVVQHRFQSPDTTLDGRQHIFDVVRNVADNADDGRLARVASQSRIIESGGGHGAEECQYFQTAHALLQRTDVRNF